MSREIHNPKPGLIQDITYRKAIPHDRHGKVEHTATIGELDDVWQRQGRTAYHGLGIMPYSGQRVQDAKKPQSQYDPALRVAPLSLYEDGSPEDTRDSAGRSLNTSAILIWTALSAFVVRCWLKIRNATKYYVPKKYTLVHGAHTDWHTAYMSGLKRFGVPLAAAVFLLIAVLAVPDNHPPVTPPPKKGHNPAVTVHNASDDTSDPKTNSTKGGSTATSGDGGSVASIPSSATSASQGSAPSLSGAYTPPSPLFGGVAGGYGGSSSTPDTNSTNNTDSSTSPTTGESSPTLGNIPGVTTPYPVTIPGQTINLDDKPVISTSPTTTTLN